MIENREDAGAASAIQIPEFSREVRTQKEEARRFREHREG